MSESQFPYNNDKAALSVLDARVPRLCPESGGHDNHGPLPSLGCDLCPTVGRMLAEWQPLTALADAVSAALNAMDEGYASRQHGLTVMDRALSDIRDAMDGARVALEAVRRG